MPEKVTFATKPALAVGMISRAVAASVPFSWVSGDRVYGVGEIEMLLRRLGKGYVLGVTDSHQIWSWNTGMSVSGTAADIALKLEPSCWQRISAGSGTKGKRSYDWVHCELAILTAAKFGADVRGLWTRGLLIRRSISDQNLAFYTTWPPAGTPVETLARVEGARWAIEDAFETAKTQLDLDHNETRSWHGWHRHVSLIMLAFAMLAAVKRRANERPSGGQKKGAAQRLSSSAGRCRKFAASHPDWP